MIPTPDLVRAETRIPRWMIALALLGALTTLLAWSPRHALGFSVGAIFGILNYFWLHEGVVALVRTERERVPKTVVFKMLARYPLSLAAMFWVYTTGWLPVLPVIAGLLIPGFGVLIESLFLIGSGLRRN